jgi:hypothetical protein
MLVEKYLIIGIKYSRDVVIDVVKQSSYSNNLIDPISVMKEPREDIFVDYYEVSTKSKAIDRLNEISKNVSNIKYWSILPVMVNVSVEEARFLKLKRLNKKMKRR